jgi:hypothetical protein
MARRDGCLSNRFRTTVWSKRGPDFPLQPNSCQLTLPIANHLRSRLTTLTLACALPRLEACLFCLRQCASSTLRTRFHESGSKCEYTA